MEKVSGPKIYAYQIKLLLTLKRVNFETNKTTTFLNISLSPIPFQAIRDRLKQENVFLPFSFPKNMWQKIGIGSTAVSWHWYYIQGLLPLRRRWFSKGSTDGYIRFYMDHSPAQSQEKTKEEE